jgi:hypothetical protein
MGWQPGPSIRSSSSSRAVCWGTHTYLVMAPGAQPSLGHACCNPVSTHPAASLSSATTSFASHSWFRPHDQGRGEEQWCSAVHVQPVQVTCLPRQRGLLAISEVCLPGPPTRCLPCRGTFRGFSLLRQLLHKSSAPESQAAIAAQMVYAPGFGLIPASEVRSCSCWCVGSPSAIPASKLTPPVLAALPAPAVQRPVRCCPRRASIAAAGSAAGCRARDAAWRAAGRHG